MSQEDRDRHHATGPAPRRRPRVVGLTMRRYGVGEREIQRSEELLVSIQGLPLTTSSRVSPRAKTFAGMPMMTAAIPRVSFAFGNDASSASITRHAQRIDAGGRDPAYLRNLVRDE